MVENKFVCVKCGSKNIHIKKRMLCRICYQREYKKSRESFIPERSSIKTVVKYKNEGEIRFATAFFNSQNWKYHPACFRLSNGTSYTPDFYDVERNMFIEVYSTRQAYHQNKEKIETFKKEFPYLSFEVRDTFGRIIEDLEYGDKWTCQLNKEQSRLDGAA